MGLVRVSIYLTEKTPMLAKIIIAIGNEVDAELVVKSGLALAEKFGSQVMLLHVVDPSLPDGFSPLVGGCFRLLMRRRSPNTIDN